MQVSKLYEGNIANIGTASARQVSYGVSTTVSVYQNRVDLVNQTVADFLHNVCGVDAAYEARAGSSYKFLWIYNVPFLFCNSSSTIYYFAFYGPLYATALNPGTNSNSGTSSGVSSGLVANSLFFPNNNSGTNYKFTLYFDGDPEKGFALRIKGLTYANISNGFYFTFAKAKNILSGRDAVIWKYGGAVSGSAGQYVNGVDLDENGEMVESSFSNNYINYYPTLFTKEPNKTDNPGKFPLVPMLFGAWKPENIYQRPSGFDLPAPVATTEEIQAAISIAGRKFIVTSQELSPAKVMSSNYMNLGLLEVTE